MCMWQSHALAGALSLGASVPDEYGTCWASLLRKLSRLLSSETLCWPWPLPWPCARPLRGNDEPREGFRRLGSASAFRGPQGQCLAPTQVWRSV